MSFAEIRLSTASCSTGSRDVELSCSRFTADGFRRLSSFLPATLISELLLREQMRRCSAVSYNRANSRVRLTSASWVIALRVAHGPYYKYFIFDSAWHII